MPDFPDFPDVTIGADGRLQLSGPGFDPLSQAYQTAAQTCAALLPAGTALPDEPGVPPTPVHPSVGFTCTGDCPTPPSAPARPS